MYKINNKKKKSLQKGIKQKTKYFLCSSVIKFMKYLLSTFN